jgi:hypothetical protein
MISARPTRYAIEPTSGLVLAAVAAGFAADIVSTQWGITHGLLYEANPAAVHVAAGGVATMALVKLLAFSALCVLAWFAQRTLRRPAWNAVAVVLAVLAWLPATWNVALLLTAR